MTCVVRTLRMPNSWQMPEQQHVHAGRIDVGELGEVCRCPSLQFWGYRRRVQSIGEKGEAAAIGSPLAASTPS